jgi:hypothetical protein
LEQWSREWVVAHDPQRDRPMDDQVRGGWLGFAPASPADIAAAEQRLGRPLPPSLRSFLLITDGWKHAGNFIYRLAGTAQLDWLRNTEDVHWADAYDDPVIRRSLRISLAGDASILFLDPMDVDKDGEWAAYELASWSGTDPKRHDSFAELMLSLYASFHALRKPPGDTRDRWHAQVAQARRAALRGDIDEPAKVFAAAQQFGSHRARILRFQLYAMQGDWYTAPLAELIVAAAEVIDDPLFEAELLPLLFAEARLTHRARSTVDLFRQGHPAGPAIERYDARRREPGFRQQMGNPEFDAAVRELLDDLAAGSRRSDAGRRIDLDTALRTPQTPFIAQPGVPAGDPRQPRCPTALLDAAWPRLKAAMSTWRPVSDCHIAPVVLFTDPLLTEMITPERGRELLRTPRG